MMDSEWLTSELIDRHHLLRFADAGSLYALLDSCDSPAVLAKVQELAAASLFENTPYADYWAQAPYLVKADGGVVDWIASTLAQEPWGIFVLTNAGSDDVRAHLQRFLVVQLPDGEKWFFRYYDPRVLNVYLPSCNGEEVRQFFGPIRGLAVARSAEQVELVEPALAASGLSVTAAPWPIRAEQYQAFAQTRLQDFEHRAADHLREFFPEQCSSLGNAALQRAIAYGVQRARYYGITTECDVCRFLDLMFGFGPDFDCDPKLPWATEILSRSDMPEPAARLAILYERLEQMVKGAEQHEPA